MCKAHNQVLRLYCYTCSQLICRDCIIYDHTEPDHKHTFVKEAASQCREKLRDSAAPLRQAITEITAAATDVQAAKREVAENLASVSITIQQSMDEIKLFGHLQLTLPFYMQKRTWPLSSIEAWAERQKPCHCVWE